jgi:hypothetical protein
VTGYGIAVIEMRHFWRVKCHGFLFIEAHGNLAALVVTLDGSEIPVRNSQGSVGSGELCAVADRKLEFKLMLGGDAPRAGWVVGHFVAAQFTYGLGIHTRGANPGGIRSLLAC